MSRTPASAAGATFLLLSWLPSVFAQTPPRATFDDPFLRPPHSVPRIEERARQLRFELVADIALPGPLPGDGPRLVGDRIEIPVAGAVASTSWPAATGLSLRESEPSGAAPASDSSAWVEDPRGRYRSRALPGGTIKTQKRCKRCRKGWNKIWRLRVPGNTLAPPLLTERRLFFGALDNRVYAVKKRNGHRLWQTDVGERVSKPLVWWSQRLPDADDEASTEIEVILVVPDIGSRLVALDARTGQRVAQYELGEEGGELVSVPLATPDGRIILARQSYTRTEASLLVLLLGPQSATAAGAPDLPYNARVSGNAAPETR